MLLAETTQTAATVLQWVTAIGAIATPVLVLILTGLGYIFREKWTRQFKLFDTLREDRTEIYNEILEPFVILLMSDTQWKLQPENAKLDKKEEALKRLLSLKYRKAAFRLSLIADDGVVRAYSDLMQYTFRLADNTPQPVEGENQTNEIVTLLASFLLSIRKSIGNKYTKIDAIGMIEWFITDARKMRK